MSEQDESSRTEEPTPRRLQEARERGQVVQSQELQVWAGLTGAALAFAMLVPSAASRMAHLGLPFLERPESMEVGLAHMRAAVAEIAIQVGVVAGPTLGLLAVCGIGCGLAQTGFLWSPQRIAPDFSRISPLKGVGRLVSMRTVVEFAKNLAKFAVVSTVLTTLLMPMLSGVDQWAALPVPDALREVGSVIRRMVMIAAIMMTVVAGADWVWQRFSFLKRMRMTRQELRDEFRQSDGDPHIKARLRRLREERSRQRMMAAVPTATVVITNPTHYAVALSWDPLQMPAPKVVAKGMDQVALRIRRVAEESGVPVTENPPLARSLHAAVELDEEIPPEHYEAVAQVIGWVMRGRGARAAS